MSDGKILYTLPLAAITPTVTGSDAGFLPAKLNDGDPNTKHRYTHDDQTVTWDAGGGLTALVAAISIHNHNIPSDATVTYQNCDDGASWANDTAISLVQGVDNFCLLGSSYNKRYHRVVFSLLASQAIDIGELCLWSSILSLSPNYSSKSPIIRVGYAYRNNGKGKKNKTAVSGGYGRRLIFANWTEANCGYFDTVMAKPEICFIPDAAVNKCYHGVIDEDTVEKESLFNGNISFQVTFLENALKV